MLDRIDVKYFKLAVGTEHIGKENNNDIAVRCPICGDSYKKKNSKRLHLYQKGNVTNISCFNGGCPVHNKTVYSFLRDFYPALLSGYKREKFQNDISNLSNPHNSEIIDVFKNIKKDTPKHELNILTQDLSQYFTPIQKNQDCLNYLESRNIPYCTSFGQWYYGHQNLKINEVTYNIKDSIIIPLYINNKIYGFYSRSINSKFFCTYMNDANIGYKIWNWFNINKSEPVYIFEGIFDAISSGFSNVIACMGAKIPDERLNELQNPIFVLDNDRTGLLNSLNYAKKHKVYIQPDNIKEKDFNAIISEHPNINPNKLINDNLFSGILAEVKIRRKL